MIILSAISANSTISLLDYIHNQDDEYLKRLYLDMNSSARMEPFTVNEPILNSMIKNELWVRGYTIVPGTCVPQIIKIEVDYDA